MILKDLNMCAIEDTLFYELIPAITCGIALLMFIGAMIYMAIDGPRQEKWNRKHNPQEYK